MSLHRTSALHLHCVSPALGEASAFGAQIALRIVVIARDVEARALQYALYVRLYLRLRGDGSGRRLLIGSRSGRGDSRDGFGRSDGVFIDVGSERGQHIGGQQRGGFGRSGLRCVRRATRKRFA